MAGLRLSVASPRRERGLPLGKTLSREPGARRPGTADRNASRVRTPRIDPLVQPGWPIAQQQRPDQDRDLVVDSGRVVGRIGAFAGSRDLDDVVEPGIVNEVLGEQMQAEIAQRAAQRGLRSERLHHDTTDAGRQHRAPRVENPRDLRATEARRADRIDVARLDHRQAVTQPGRHPGLQAGLADQPRGAGQRRRPQVRGDRPRSRIAARMRHRQEPVVGAHVEQRSVGRNRRQQGVETQTHRAGRW